MSRPKPHPLSSEIAAPGTRTGLTRGAFAEDDPSLAQVIGRHFDVNTISNDRADAKLAHLSCRIGDDAVAVIQHYGEASVGEYILYEPFHRQQFFFRQFAPFRSRVAQPGAEGNRAMKCQEAEDEIAFTAEAGNISSLSDAASAI